MEGTILIEFLIGIGRIFINPLLYVAIIMAIFLGYRRVKRERRNFNIRLLSGWSEFSGILRIGFVLPLCVSLLSLVVGLTVPVEFLLVLTVVSIVALLLYVFHFLSAIVTFSVALGILVVMDWQQWTLSLGSFELAGVNYLNGMTITITLLAGLLLIVEGVLIKRDGPRFASPIEEKTKRGLHAVAFFSKKIWLLPVFFIVPGQVVDAYFPWWPQFTLDSEQFAFVLFPVVIGFQQFTRRTLPVYMYQKLARSVIILGEVVVLGGLVSWFNPLVGLIVMVVACVIRLVIAIVYKRKEHQETYAVIRSANGAMIAAVLPESPAEKMGLQVGEVIKRVNGQEIYTEGELYEALQINAAHCRLEVLNHQNEIRLTQHVVHADDHHRIGLILVH